jgi:hypothetical protein
MHHMIGLIIAIFHTQFQKERRALARRTCHILSTTPEGMPRSCSTYLLERKKTLKALEMKELQYNGYNHCNAEKASGVKKHSYRHYGVRQVNGIRRASSALGALYRISVKESLTCN